MNSNLATWVGGATWAGGDGVYVGEPSFDSADELRLHRQRQTALSYRLFGAFGWGSLGDGHITARDPERTDCFWLLRYGVAFREARVSDLVLVGPDGTVVEGEGPINMTAYYIHGPIHEARPEAVCVAHTHTPYATSWAANVRPFRMICPGSHRFFQGAGDLLRGEDVQVTDAHTGKHIAAALEEAKLIFLRNHGPVTVGRSVDRGDRLVSASRKSCRGAHQGPRGPADLRRCCMGGRCRDRASHQCSVHLPLRHHVLHSRPLGGGRLTAPVL